MSLRTHFSNAYRPEQSTTTTDVLAHSLTFTSEASAKYLILATWMQSVSTSNPGVSWLKVNSTTVTEAVDYPRNAADYTACGGAYVLETGGAPATQTVEIRFGSASATTIYVKECRISVLKLTSDDYYAQDLALYSTTETSWTDILSVNITPESNKYYLFITSATIGTDGVANRVFTKVDAAGTQYCYNGYQPNNVNNLVPAFLAQRGALYSGATRTVKTQYRAYGNLAASKYNVLVALEMTGAEFTMYYGQDTTTRSTTSSALTNSYEPANGSDIETGVYMFIGSKRYNVGSNAYFGYSAFLRSGNMLRDAVQERVDYGTSSVYGRTDFLVETYEQRTGDVGSQAAHAVASGSTAYTYSVYFAWLKIGDLSTPQQNVKGKFPNHGGLLNAYTKNGCYNLAATRQFGWPEPAGETAWRDWIFPAPLGVSAFIPQIIFLD